MRGRSKWLDCCLLAVALLLLFLTAAPSRSTSGGCLFCGRGRHEAWLLGIKIKDRVQDTQASTWIDEMYPNHTNHIWSGGSTEIKWWGFGRRSFGCGGLGESAVGQIHYLRSQLGEAQARQFLQRYHSELSRDEQNIRHWLRSEFDSLFPPDSYRTNGPSVPL